MESLIHWILKQWMLINCLVATLKLKSGETVFYLSFWKIKINVSKNTKRVMFINGLFLTVMSILFGLNHLILSWTTTKYSLSFLMIVFLWPQQWDFCLKFLTSKTPVLQLSQEVVCSSSTKLISDGVHLLILGWIDHSLIWKQLKILFRFNILQLTKLLRQFSSDVSRAISKLLLTCKIKLKSLISVLLQLWDSFIPFALSSMLS